MNGFDMGGLVGQWLMVIIVLGVGIYSGWKYGQKRKKDKGVSHPS